MPRDYEALFGKVIDGTAWTVIELGQDIFLGKRQHRNRTLRCRCQCGSEREIPVSNFFPKVRSRSCSCLQNHGAGRSTHGMYDSKEYRAWVNMVRRCYSPSTKMYYAYGARGISVCDDWRGPGGFEKFLAEVGMAPSADSQIDRINNAGNYEPGNVHWVTRSENSNNRRSNVMLTFKGQTMTATQWAAELGIPARIIRRRTRSGWSVERALTTPAMNVAKPEYEF